MPAAFSLPTPLHPPRRRTRPSHTPLPTSHAKSPTPPRTRTRNSPRLPTPTTAPTLLRNPESVLAATAAGLFVLASTAYRSARRALTTLTARAATTREAYRLAARLAKREQERAFLESAVSATAATLDNSRAFLAAQRGRAESAEARLAQLGVSRARLDAAAGDARRRRRELGEAERALAAERRRAGADVEVLARMEGEVGRARQALEGFERRVTEERGAVRDAEGVQKRRLREAGRETARLEALLLEKEGQLEREVRERDRYLEVFAERERELGQASEVFERTVSDLEVRRKSILDVEEEVERVREVAERNRAGLEAVLGTELPAGEIQKSLERIRGEQQNIRASLVDTQVRHMEKQSERQALMQELAAQDRKLQQLRGELEKVPVSDHVVDPEENSTVRNKGFASEEESAESSTSFGDTAGTPVVATGAVLSLDSVASDAGIMGGHEKESIDVSSLPSRVNGNSAHTSAVNKANLHATHAQRGGATEEEMTADSTSPATGSTSYEPRPKRGRGRPRKTESSPPTGVDVTKPKRGRGRPRKVANDVAVAKDLVPKRKRGRPRKNPPPPLVSQHAKSQETIS